jgi:hypothetical protein
MKIHKYATLVCTTVLMSCTTPKSNPSTAFEDLPSTNDSKIAYLEQQVKNYAQKSANLERQLQTTQNAYTQLTKEKRTLREHLGEISKSYLALQDVSEKVYDSVLVKEYADVVLARRNLQAKLKPFGMLQNPKPEYDILVREVFELGRLTMPSVFSQFPLTAAKYKTHIVLEFMKVNEAISEYNYKYVKPQSPLNLPQSPKSDEKSRNKPSKKAEDTEAKKEKLLSKN